MPTESEYRKVVELTKAVLNKPSKEIPQELIALEKKLERVKKEVERLKEEKPGSLELEDAVKRKGNLERKIEKLKNDYHLRF